MSVADGEITENMDDRVSTLYNKDNYSWNVACLGGGAFEGLTDLKVSTSIFEKSNLRKYKTHFFPSRFTSPATIDTSVAILLFFPGEIGVVFVAGKLGQVAIFILVLLLQFLGN